MEIVRKRMEEFVRSGGETIKNEAPIFVKNISISAAP
jgi:hypothetical protein